MNWMMFYQGPFSIYSRKGICIVEIQKVDIVKIVEDLTSNLVKMLFGQSLSKILSEVITQKTENKDE